MRLTIHTEFYDGVVPTEDTRPLAAVVERIVRPLKMRTQHRSRVRNDLMAHLIAIRDEERAAGGDEKAVLERTIARFGDPAALSVEIGSQTRHGGSGGSATLKKSSIAGRARDSRLSQHDFWRSCSG
jgi:hypothetical protein